MPYEQRYCDAKSDLENFTLRNVIVDVVVVVVVVVIAVVHVRLQFPSQEASPSLYQFRIVVSHHSVWKG